MLSLSHLPCYNRAMSPDDHPDAPTRRTRSLTAYPELGLLAVGQSAVVPDRLGPDGLPTPVWERVRAACVRMGHTRGRAFKLESVRGGVRVTRTRLPCRPRRDRASRATIQACFLVSDPPVGG